MRYKDIVIEEIDGVGLDWVRIGKEKIPTEIRDGWDIGFYYKGEWVSFSEIDGYEV